MKFDQLLRGLFWRLIRGCLHKAVILTLLVTLLFLQAYIYTLESRSIHKRATHGDKGMYHTASKDRPIDPSVRSADTKNTLVNVNGRKVVLEVNMNVYLNDGVNVSRVIDVEVSTKGDNNDMKSKGDNFNKPAKVSISNNFLRNSKVQNQRPKSLLTLCTTWFPNPSKYLLYNNTLFNWASLRPFVNPVLFADDPEMANICSQLGWSVFRPNKTSNGMPVLKYMIMEVMRRYDSEFYGYANGDILFTSSLWESLSAIRYSNLNLSQPVLIIGQRTNVMNISKEEARTHANLTATAQRRGEQFIEWAEDYFFTNYLYPWNDIPEVIVSRLGYDNWLVWNSIKIDIPVVDATKTLLSVHQTDKEGNWASSNSKANANYNIDLLTKYFNSTIPFNRGRVDCATYKTEKIGDTILIDKKEPAQICLG